MRKTLSMLSATSKEAAIVKCPAWLLAQPIAHRGFHSGTAVPENSFAAARGAIERGYAIELDVQLTADGDVAVFHDFSLKRLTGVDNLVGQTRTGDLRKLRLLDTQEPIPLFSEILEMAWGKTPLLVEIKNEGPVGPLEMQVSKLIRGYRGDIAVQSFNPHTVRWFRTSQPDLPCGLLAASFNERDDMSTVRKAILRNALLAPYSRPHFISYELAALTGIRWFAFTQILRLPLLLWTIRNEQEARRARQFDANIIFEGFSPPAGR